MKSKSIAIDGENLKAKTIDLDTKTIVLESSDGISYSMVVKGSVSDNTTKK